MPVSPATIEAAAVAVHDGYQRQARRSNDDGPSASAVAAAAADSIRISLTALSAQLEPDEVLVDYTHFEKYKVGMRGVSLSMTMVGATNRRLWHLAYADGVVSQILPMQLETVTTQKKTMTATIVVEPRPDGVTLTGPKSVCEWVAGIQRDRPQAPVRLIAAAEAAAAGGAAPATGAPAGAWHPDPTGRHELRYWDGARWTEHVSDGGATSVDHAVE